MLEFQRTIGDRVVFEGEGIFTGKEIRVELYPLAEWEGIIFERADLPNSPKIKLSIDNIVPLDGVVLITDGKNNIFLIEHLLSLLNGLGIDNLLIKVFGEEIPLLDGSVLPILRKIQEKGYRVLPALKRKFILKKPFVIENGKGKITFKPSTYLEIFARIDFDHPLIGAQEYTFRYSPLNYWREISFARTFGFKNLLEERKRKGILKGGNLSNAIVLDERGILTEEGLRTPDEFVRHKILDIMGDIYVLGAPLLAKIEALCSGHKLHIEALKTLYQLGLIEEVEERAITFFWLPKKKGQAI